MVLRKSIDFNISGCDESIHMFKTYSDALCKNEIDLDQVKMELDGFLQVQTDQELD